MARRSKAAVSSPERPQGEGSVAGKARGGPAWLTEGRLNAQGIVEILPFDEADARAAGEVRAQLERVGQPIGAYDALIAGQAVRRGLTLVTANAREFERVDGLMCEDWAR